MGKEEQQEEREVLDSIFPDEIQDVSESEYRITMTLDVTEKEADEEIPAPVILLNVRYPAAYPDEAPLLDITAPPNAPKHPQFDVQEDKAQLLEALQPTIEESIGMAMVFTLVSALKDSAELLIAKRQQAKEEEHETELRKAEEEENRKFEGQKVTRETFLAWRDKFNAELREDAERRKVEQEAEDKKKRSAKADEKKLTGKQLWEQGLATKAADEDEEGEDAVESITQLSVES
ncbi:RWD-domain-containing protein [Polychaeton citri CBS 116435]|uniref:RWD-domain-containing protein n=1 Tax=Polychaeton citri CBS 116435 TaxID=1314669 RepID=A0A9P4UKR4_9PEZI|nr:RWD-domain-containing protein [Polychaeton citri CBS 116435]